MPGIRLGLRGWVAVSGVLLLVAGGCLGFLAARMVDRGGADDASAEALPPVPEIRAPSHPSDSSIYKELNLSEEQRRQADRILAQHFQQLRHLREEIEGLGGKVEKDLTALLDDDQREGMRELIRRMKINEVARRVSDELAFYRREVKFTAQQENDIYPFLLSDHVERDNSFRESRSRRQRSEKAEREKGEREKGEREKGEREKGEREKSAGEMNEWRAALKKLDEELHAKLKTVLDDAQFAKWQEVERRRWPGMRGPRQGPPSGKSQSTKSSVPKSPPAPSGVGSPAMTAPPAPPAPPPPGAVAPAPGKGDAPSPATPPPSAPGPAPAPAAPAPPPGI